jgi:hypothetical protein
MLEFHGILSNPQPSAIDEHGGQALPVAGGY